MPEKCYPCTWTNLLPMYLDYTLQQLQHINYNEFHPFRIDPRTIKDTPIHLCPICKWEHTGKHLKGRPEPCIWSQMGKASFMLMTSADCK